MTRRLAWLGVGAVVMLFVGCVEKPPSATSEVPATTFNAAMAGTIEGEVTWTGDVPTVPPFALWKVLETEKKKGRFLFDNPNAPCIHPEDHGVGNAVVFLRGVTAQSARPWDLPPAQVQIGSDGIRIHQGDTNTRVGFVRRGSAVEMVSTQEELQTLRATGAAFFTLPFPDPNQPLSRPLTHPGLVEWTSGSGHFWMRAYLFVDAHPYYTRTDSHGRFVLPQVPAGRYEVVCWAPNWNVAAHERDPETSRIARLTFDPPTQKLRTVEVRAGEISQLRFELSSDDFDPKR